MKHKQSKPQKPNAVRAKTTVYLSPDVYDEIMAEAKRQDRSIGWLLRKAWEMSKGRIEQMRPDEGNQTKE